MSTLGERVARRNANAPIILPTMATGRQPYLFVKALTIGPVKIEEQ